MKKFTMEDVEAAHALKPHLPKKTFVKKFAYLNSKIRKGWNMEKIMALFNVLNNLDEHRNHKRIN